MKSNINVVEMQKLAKEIECDKEEMQLLQNWDSVWDRFQQRSDIDLEETAKETKALQRKREISSAKDLLRLIMFYTMSGWSFRLTGLWALLSGIGNLSDVAIRKRVRNSKVWLEKLVGIILVRRLEGLRDLPGIRLRVIDGTTICCPGSKNMDWRIHLSFDLGNLCLDKIELTDKYGGESLARFESQGNEINVADGGYSIASGMQWILSSGAGLIVRINWRNVPVHGPNGERFEIIPWLKTLTAISEKQIWMNTPKGWFQLRLIASPMPPEKAEEARQRACQRHQRKQHPISENTLLAAGFVILLTNLPEENWSGHLILGLYRMRWQIELTIKRLKSLLEIDHLRAKNPDLAQTYLLSKLLMALMIDEMINMVGLQQPDWFDSVDRPINVFRTTMLFCDAFRQIIAGPWFAATHIFSERLRRYLCDAPRRRLQQLAWVRALIQHLSQSGAFP